MARAFGAARASRMARDLAAFAAGFGIHDLRAPDRIPSTRKALALAEWARDQGRLHPFRDAVMGAHWREGRDIEDDWTLAELAGRAGLDPAAAREALGDPRYAARVDAMNREAAAEGVTAIPTLVAGDRAVVGCQPYEELAALAEGAGARRR